MVFFRFTVYGLRDEFTLWGLGKGGLVPQYHLFGFNNV